MLLVKGDISTDVQEYTNSVLKKKTSTRPKNTPSKSASSYFSLKLKYQVHSKIYLVQ